MFSLLISIAISANPVDVWPAFRGGGNSVSAAKNLPLKWSDKDGVAWTTKLPGTGQSSPVIWRDRAFVTSVDGGNKEKAVPMREKIRKKPKIFKVRSCSSMPP